MANFADTYAPPPHKREYKLHPKGIGVFFLIKGEIFLKKKCGSSGRVPALQA
jgi:hypothetical protein